MVVYSLHSEAEWNQLCEVVAALPLTSNDIVRIDASFSVGTIGGTPVTPLTIGPATLNGSPDGSINVLTIVCDKTVTFLPLLHEYQKLSCHDILLIRLVSVILYIHYMLVKDII
jgi:hypothetical protein